MADAVDGLAMALSPGVPMRSRRATLGGGRLGGDRHASPRAFADERAAAKLEAVLTVTSFETE